MTSPFLAITTYLGIPLNLNFGNLKSIDSTSGLETNLIMSNPSNDIAYPSTTEG